MNDLERSLLKEALKGGRIVEVVSNWSNSINYGVVIGDIVSYIYPGGYDDVDYLVNDEDEDNYYVNRVLELKHGARININMGKSFGLYEGDFNVVYTRKKRLTLEEIDYDIEYLMINNGRMRYIIKTKLNGDDYVISRRSKLDEYIIIDPLKKFEEVGDYIIYENKDYDVAPLY